METYKPGISVAAGGLMLKWDLLDNLMKLHVFQGNDVNVFINFESIIRNVSIYKNILPLINFHKQKLVIELESSILNLVSNYRRYFIKNNLNPKIYLYYTTLIEDTQHMSMYNKFYRSYYHNRYMQNPQYKLLGELLNNIVIPEIKLILSYIPNCYLIESKTFDSSIIPLIISKSNQSNNVILTSDIFDTLYLFDKSFMTIYIKRRYSKVNVITNTSDAVESIIRNENPFDMSIFESEMYYRLLLSIKGSKIRNIRSAKGFGYGKFMKILNEGLDNGIVLKDFESIDSILQLFPTKYQSDIKLAFRCTDIEVQYNLLSEVDVSETISQMIDKSDIESLNALNNKRFLEYPIDIKGLLE